MVSQKLNLSNPNEIRILTFGASLVEGYTDFGAKFHPYSIELHKTLSDLLPDYKITVDTNGESGDRVLPSLGGRFLTRLEAACPLRPNKYDLVVILGGTNDLGMLVNDPDAPSKVFEGIKNCCDHVLRTGTSVLCLSVPERAIDTHTSALAKRAKQARLELNEKLESFGRRCQESEQKQGGPGVFVMDLAVLVPFPPDQSELEDGQFVTKIWSPDGIHMTSEGYDYTGKEIANFIHKLII